MDRAAPPTEDDRSPTPGDPTEPMILPSRREALAKMQSALRARAGVVLLTGEPGLGKSWLLEQLRETREYRWVSVDLTPEVTPVEFYRLLLAELGLDAARSIAEARSALVGFLTDRGADEEQWCLIVEEAHSAPDRTLEEIRVLGNRLGAEGALAGIMLAGQNLLIRRLMTEPLRPLASRLSAHVHLNPISLEELWLWVALEDGGGVLDASRVEILHRDFSGNPRRLRLQLSRLLEGSAPTRSVPTTAVPLHPAPDREPAPRREETPVKPGWGSSLGAPPKPPIAVDDGMIEVGWDAEEELSQEPEPARTLGTGNGVETHGSLQREATDARPLTPRGEAVVDDHYAALQAWKEWSRNQAQASVPPRTATLESIGPEDEPDLVDETSEGNELATPLQPPAGVWAEGQHTFAPYSQLFSRMRQSQDPR